MPCAAPPWTTAAPYPSARSELVHHSFPHGILLPAANAASFLLGDSCFTEAGFTKQFSGDEQRECELRITPPFLFGKTQPWVQKEHFRSFGLEPAGFRREGPVRTLPDGTKGRAVRRRCQGRVDDG